MKPLLLIVCTCAALSAYGQGTTLQFCNHCLPSPPDRLVRDVDGNPLAGTNYVAQLYIGTSPDNLLSTTAAPARFRDLGAPLPGTWQPQTIRILSWPWPPGSIYLQVRVWDTMVAQTYTQAEVSPTGQYGRSEVFVYDPCPGLPGVLPPACERMVNFRGFTLRTNMPVPLTARPLTGGTLEISWPAEATGFALEVKTNVSGPSVWEQVPTVPRTNEGRCYIEATPVGAYNMYRLRRIAVP
jgi:hypothetical protein